MIIDMSAFVKEIDELYGKPDDLGNTRALQVSMVLVKAWDKGMGFERDRIKAILQRKAIHAQDLIREIDKPVR